MLPSLIPTHIQGFVGVASRRRRFPARDVAQLITTCHHIITFNSSTQSTRLHLNIKHRLENAAPFPPRACQRSSIWGRDDAVLPQLPVPPPPRVPVPSPVCHAEQGGLPTPTLLGVGVLREAKAGAHAFQKSCGCFPLLTYK